MDDTPRFGSLFRTRPGVKRAELLSLRFRSKQLESNFLSYYFYISLFQSRMAFFLAFLLIIGDYIADSVIYGLGQTTGNYLRIPIAFGSLALVYASYFESVKRKYELYIMSAFVGLSGCLFFALYLIDKANGNGIVSIVGMLNLFFVLIFVFILVGSRFYYSVFSACIAASIYILFMIAEMGPVRQFYYYIYQITTVMLLAMLLGYTRELALRADFCTQVELERSRSEKEQNDARYLAWLRQLAGFLRHEVRGPVGQINSSLELMQMVKNSDAFDIHIAHASTAVNSVWNLIERASRATDVEAFVRQGETKSIQVGILVRNLTERFRKMSSGVGFLTEICDENLVTMADPVLLEEALNNILQNAVSFADEDTDIEIVVNRSDNNVTIDVTNKGPTIVGDSEKCFVQFSSTRSGAQSEHHGLGLYMVRLICEYYGGSAHIKNLNDKTGVCASMAFPLAA